ncbi:MAG: pilus assembly protein CpaE, partial [Pseudomonadota bacterium]
MSGQTRTNQPGDNTDDLDFDLDLDNLDDEALQRLLEEDPALEEELRALEAEELDFMSEETADAQDGASASDLYPGEDQGLYEELGEAEAVHTDESVSEADVPPHDPSDPPFVATPEHDDLADYDYDETISGAEVDVPPIEVHTAPEVEASPDEALALSIRPVPRINVHVFCTSEKMQALVEQATMDRRFSKAHVTIQSGDAHYAAEMFAHESTPNLLVLEAGGDPTTLLAGLDALAQVCDPSTRVIVVGEINDIRLYRELMERGISDYVVTPPSPLHLIKAIGDLYADPSAPPIGKSLVFVGARGGSGSSSICHNVAWAIAEEMKTDTVLLDLDLAFGTASLDFEQDPSQGLTEALLAPERLDDVLLDRLLQKCTDRLSLFAAPNVLERDYDMPTESYETVVDMLRGSAPCIAVDLPHLWSSWARLLLQTADEIVLTATPDLSSFRNAKNIVETIKAQRSNDAPPILVLNQTNVPK